MNPLAAAEFAIANGRTPLAIDSQPDYALPTVLPVAWNPPKPSKHAPVFGRLDGLKVIVSIVRELDGKRWLHVSCSKRNKLPTWEDLREVKDLFVGVDRKAIQVLPSRAEYVNVHPYVLHLWCCLDGDGLPDFTAGSGQI